MILTREQARHKNAFVHAGTKLLTPLLLSSAFLASSHTFAEVQSLTSSELTETYIEDSTIIITPERNAPSTGRTTSSDITIEPIDTQGEDIEALQINQDQIDSLSTAFELSDELMRNTNVALTLNPNVDIQRIDTEPGFEEDLIPSYQDQITLPVAEVLNDERYRIPEGDFDFEYVGNELGLSRTGEQLTFSIGNLPGIDQINLPEGVNDGGPLQIIPNEAGGFDLTINIPEQ